MHTEHTSTRRVRTGNMFLLASGGVIKRATTTPGRTGAKRPVSSLKARSVASAQQSWRAALRQTDRRIQERWRRHEEKARALVESLDIDEQQQRQFLERLMAFAWKKVSQSGPKLITAEYIGIDGDVKLVDAANAWLSEIEFVEKGAEASPVQMLLHLKAMLAVLAAVLPRFLRSRRRRQENERLTQE